MGALLAFAANGNTLTGNSADHNKIVGFGLNDSANNLLNGNSARKRRTEAGSTWDSRTRTR